MNKKTKIVLFSILFLAFFLRVYEFKNFYIFSHDQDLASWIIKDILINGHLRLIGQETSSHGVFIGGLFYYLQIPFYLLGQMNPVTSIFLPVILGVFATFSSFFVVSKIVNLKTGLVASFIYAASALIVFTDREVVPTMPVMLWSIWYLYSLYLIYKTKQLEGFILWGFLLGLVWHFNLALIILSPLILIALLYSKEKINLKNLILGLVVLFITSLPLLIFEYRHDFSQSKAIFLSLTSNKDYIENTARGFAKLDRVMQLVNRNSINLFSKVHFIRPSIVLWTMIVIFIYLVKSKKIPNFLTAIIIVWQLTYILFFSKISLNVSEYYFNGMNIIWILIVSMGLDELLKTKKKSYIFYGLIGLFLISNIYYVVNYNSDRKGYVEKIALVREIKKDSEKNGYPCISISYITSPGYDMGYRYLYWLEKMHVNKPSSLSPVYTIVFPHSLVNQIDKSFGSLGLIYPDYKRYNESGVSLSCQGQNANLTDPMFGYTE
jgi:hypothetical protein